MHDPLVVAFEIRRPWPSFRKHPLFKDIRWGIHGSNWTVAGRGLYFPSLVTVWHREPGGHDSGTVCKMHRHNPETGWQFYHGWRFHIHHWKIQIHPVQRLRRSLLTRCSWCGGRQRKGDPVSISHQWDGARGPWWKGDRGLFHHDCSSVERAHRLCLCEDPGLDYGNYGKCAFCGGFRAYGKIPDKADRLLASLPAGSRIPVEMRPQLEEIWGRRLRAEGVDPKTTVLPWRDV